MTNARYLFAACAALLLAAQPLQAQTVTVRSKDEAVALVAKSIEDVRGKQAALPPPASDTETLKRMAELEQAPRLVLSQFDLSALGEPEKQAMWSEIWGHITPIDKANQQQLLAMLPAEGWFSISRYGRDGALAAFLIVQHSDISLWRRFLPTIEAMARTGEAEGGFFALMYDRLALNEGRPQRYGSQMTCRDGRWAVSEPVEDAAAIDAQRKSVGLNTLEENLKRFEGRGC